MLLNFKHITATAIICCILFAISSYAQSNADSALSLERIFLKPYIAGSRPDNARISDDGKFIIYRWDDRAMNKYRYWMMNSDGSNNHQIMDTLLGEVAIGPDNRTVACTKDGDIFITDTSFSVFERMTKTEAWDNSLQWAPNGRMLAYNADGRIYVASVWKLALYEIAKPASDNISLNFIDFFPNSKRVIFSESDREGLKEFQVPRFTGKEVGTSNFKVGVSKMRIGIAPVDTGKTIWIKLPGEERYFLGDVVVSPNGNNVIIERYSADRKKREIFVADTDSGKATLAFEESDKAWVEGGSYITRWMPKGNSFLTTSEKDGWNHLYEVSVVSKKVDQLTEGEWEIHWFDIDRTGTHIFCLANEDNHHQWLVYDIDLATSTAQPISDTIGSYENLSLSKDGTFILARQSDFAKPHEIVRINTHLSDTNKIAVDDELSVLVSKPADVKVLTQTVPHEFKSINWVIPEIVSFKSSDGRTVPAMIYKPQNFDPSKKYPVVVFVHGAGYLQNVYRGWSYYYREYMFNHRLTQLGYVVYEVEYRGSAGYGRDYRTDVYMHLGGKDLQDEIEGLDYLEKLGYVDPAHVGIYGGSYGGFMTLMGLELSDKYACGAALRAVTSWENYYRHNSWYTEARLGKPEDNAEAYKKSSPISFVDSLKKPVLILHGMVDDNVFFQDAVQYIAKLQKAKNNNFEVMMYPDEAHSFSEPESWYDEYKRIEIFFNKHLMNR